MYRSVQYVVRVYVEVCVVVGSYIVGTCILYIPKHSEKISSASSTDCNRQSSPTSPDNPTMAKK